MKKRYALPISLTLFFIFFAFTVYYVNARNKQFIMSQVSEYFEQKETALPLKFSSPKDISINIFTRRISLYDMKIETLIKKDMNVSVEPFDLERLDFHISFENILNFALYNKFEFQRATFHIDSLKITEKRNLVSAQKIVGFLNLKMPETSLGVSSPSSFEINIKKLPINLSLKIKNFESHSNSLRFSIKNLNFDLTRNFTKNQNELLHKVFMESLDIETDDYTMKGLSLESAFKINESGKIDVAGFKLLHLGSQIKFRGQLLFADSQLSLFKVSQWRTQLILNLSDYDRAFDMKSSGVLELNLDYEYPKLTGDIDGDKLNLNKLSFENLKSQFEIDAQKILIKNLIAKKQKEKISLQNQFIYKKIPSQIQINLTNFKVGSFFHKNLDLVLEGILDCNLEKFDLDLTSSCKTKENFYIKKLSLKDSLKLKPLKAQFNFQNKNQTLNYSGDIQGLSVNGAVSLKEGNKNHTLNYSSKKIDLSYIETIYDYNTSGTGSIQGNLSFFNKKLKARWKGSFENILIDGNKIQSVEASVSYENKVLSLDKLKTQINKNEYQGNIRFNFKKQFLDFNMSSPNINISDLSRFKIKNNPDLNKLSEKLLGEGPVKISGSSDLKFENLKFDLSANLFRGSFFDEYFDEIQLNIISKENFIEIKESYIERDKDQVDISGTYTHGKLDVELSSEKFYIDPLFLKKYSSLIRGTANFKALISGTLKEPVFNIKGVLVNDIFDYESDEIVFDISINKKSISGDLDFFDTRLVSTFQFPRQKGTSFFLKGSSRQFDVSKILPFLKDSEKENIKLEIDSEFNVSSKKDNMLKYRGFLSLKDVKFVSSQYVFKNKSPVKILFENNKIINNNSTLEFSSPDSQFVKLKGYTLLSGNSVNAHIEGRLKGETLQFIFPAPIISGENQFDLKLSGYYPQLKLNGFFNLKNGYIKLKELSHPIEQMSVNLLIKHNKVSIKSFQASINDSPVKAQGFVKLFEKNSLPLRISLDIPKFNLEIPRGLKTEGDLSLVLEGTKKPYKLSGSAKIKKGQSSEELGENSLNSTPPSSLLRSINEKEFTEAVVFDNFLINAKNLKFSNKSVDLNVKGIAELKGGFQNILAKGKISILPRSQFKFENHEFLVQRGVLNYNNNLITNPRVFLLSKTELKAEGTVYKINVKVEGFAEKNNITLTSTPPLTNYEILTLLRSGVRPEAFDKDERNFTNQGIYQLGNLIFSNILGNRLRQSLGVNVRFLPTKEIDPKDEFSSPKLEVATQLTDKLNFSISRSFGDQEESAVELKYRLTNKWSLQGAWKSFEETPQNTTPNTQSFDINLEFQKSFK